MITDPTETVRVATGTLLEVQMWSAELEAAGIKHQVVGDDLAGSFGTTLQGSVEIWVQGADLARAEALIEEYEASVDEVHDQSEAA